MKSLSSPITIDHVRNSKPIVFFQNLHPTPTHTSSASENANTVNLNVSAFGPQLPDQSSSGDGNAVQRDENQSNQSCLCNSPNEFVAEQDNEYANYKQDLYFPREQLATLEEKINNPRWVIPVLPGQELQILLDAAIKLCRAGMFASIIIAVFHFRVCISYLRLMFPFFYQEKMVKAKHVRDFFVIRCQSVLTKS